MMLRYVSTNRTDFVIKKSVKEFRTNLIIVAVGSIFVDEKNIQISTYFRISTSNFDNYSSVQHMILFFNFFNSLYLFVCKFFSDMSKKMKINSSHEIELIRQRREYFKFRISKQFINQIFEINDFIK